MLAQCVEGCVALHTLVGEAAGDQFGWEARVLGDLNGDGVADFVATSPTNDAGGNDAGRIYVYSGLTGQELFRVTGTTAGAWFGNSVSAAGDLNGDGIPDLIVGEPFTARGRARVFSGADGALLMTFLGQTNGDQFGFRVTGGADADGDDIPDLIISAIARDTNGNNSGSAYLYSGANFSLLCTVNGVDAADQFGGAVAFVGDLDGDERSEFVIGAQNAGNSANGRAYVYSFVDGQCALRQTLVPGSPSIEFGQFFISGRQDVDADGVPDFYVSDFNANRAHLYSGATLERLHTFAGDNNGGFGIGELLPDIDNDGYADLILAAWISPAGGDQAGKTFVYSGRTYDVLETLTHTIPGATFGFDAAGIGDINGDGSADYLISAAWDAAQRGTTYIIAGQVRPFLSGDLDFSGCVELPDLAALLAEFGCNGSSCAADIDRNGVTDLGDLARLLTNFGACR